MGRPKVIKCGVCCKTVAEQCNAIGCGFGCESWFHIECVGVNIEEHNRLVLSDEEWFCEVCGLKNNKLILTDEIKNLTQVLSVLKTDALDLKNMYDNEKKQNLILSEMCIEKEEEIVKLRNEIKFLSSRIDVKSLRPPTSFNGLNTNGSLLDFPPLNTSNRFSCLSLEDDGNNQPNLMSQSWTVSGNGPRRGFQDLRKNKDDNSCLPQSTPKQRLGGKYRNFNRGRTDSFKSNVNSDVSLTNLPNSNPPANWPKPNQPPPVRFMNHNCPQSSSNLPVRKPYPSDPVISKPVSDKSKNKLLIVGDSHARALGGYVDSYSLEMYDTFTLCRPSARIYEVVRDIELFTKNFGDKDYVVIMGGSNDVRAHMKPILNGKIKAILSSLASQTNVIFSTLPIRHGKNVNEWINQAIHQCNYELYNDDIVSKLQILPFNTMHSKYFDRKGQHLNDKGKMSLGSMIVKAINQLSQSKSCDFL